MLACLLAALIASAPNSVAIVREEEPGQKPAEVEDVGQAFTRVADRMRDVSTFFVEYRSTHGGGDHRVTLAYEAPDRACVRVESEGREMGMWMLDGRMSIRAGLTRGPEHADFDAAKLILPSEELGSAMRDLYTEERRRRVDLGPGAWFDLDLVPKDDDAAGVMPDFKVSWIDDRPHVLGWLARPETWADAEWEGGRLVIEPMPKAKLVLSPDTGFLEIEADGWAMRVEKVSIDEDLDPRIFVVPTPLEGSRDFTHESVAGFLEARPRIQHGRLYRLALRAAEAESIEDEGLRARIERAFVAYYEESLAAHYREWIEESEQRIDLYFDDAAARLAQAKNDALVRERVLEESIAWREKLESGIRQAREGHLENLSEPGWPQEQASLLTSILTIERDAVRDVHDRLLAKPLLVRFDERLESTLNDR